MQVRLPVSLLNRLDHARNLGRVRRPACDSVLQTGVLTRERQRLQSYAFLRFHAPSSEFFASVLKVMETHLDGIAS